MSLYLQARLASDDEAVLQGMMKVLELDPLHVPAHRALGLLLARTDAEQATAHFEACAGSAEATCPRLGRI